MASELRVNTLKDASGNNSVAMEYVANGSAKAWAHFENVGTPSISDSLNAASLTDTATGKCTINWTNSFNNTNFVATAHSGYIGLVFMVSSETGTRATGSFMVHSKNNGSDGDNDGDALNAILHGDLA